MIRTWKTLAVAAVVAAVFPLAAVAGGQTDNKDIGKKIDDLRGAVEKLAKKVDGLKSQSTADKAMLDDIRHRLSDVEKTLDTMKAPPPFTDRSKSFYPPPGGPPGPGAAGVGRVLLRNNYAADVTLILNNNARYRIAAFDSQEINGVPAGVLNYEVFVDGWGPRAARTTTLQPGKAVSLIVE